MKRTLAFLVLSPLLIPLLPAWAQPVAPITDCDRYAAREITRDQVTPGVMFEQIEPRVALPACVSAVERYPGSSRLLFQLGQRSNCRG